MKRATSPLLRFAFDRYKLWVQAEASARRVVVLVGEMSLLSGDGQPDARLVKLEAEALRLRRQFSRGRVAREIEIEALGQEEGRKKR